MKNRVIWLLWLFCIAGAAVITGEYLFVCVLAATGVLMIMSCIYGAFSGRKTEEQFVLPEKAEQGTAFQGKMKFTNQSFWPVFCGSGSIRWENRLTGEKDNIKIDFSMRGKTEEQVSFQGISDSCGCIKFSFTDWKAEDLFRILAFRRKADLNREMVVMPVKSHMDISILSREGFDMESFKYSKDRPGDDPGETYDIREYHSGDSIRQIHWKLSGKLDKVMIREKSYPVDEVVLILADPCLEESSPAVSEAVAEIYSAVLCSFTEQKIPCQTAVYDPVSGQLCLEKVETLQDYESVLYQFLRHSSGLGAPAVIRDYLKKPGQKTFAAYIYITGNPDDRESDLLPKEAQIVTLHRGESAAHNGNEIIFTEKNYRQELGIKTTDRRSGYGAMGNRDKKEKDGKIQPENI